MEVLKPQKKMEMDDWTTFNLWHKKKKMKSDWGLFLCVNAQTLQISIGSQTYF